MAVALAEKYGCVPKDVMPETFHSSDTKAMNSILGRKLREYAAVKLLGNYLWDVRATNAAGAWQLEPIPKAARKAIEALGLAPPASLPDAGPMA